MTLYFPDVNSLTVNRDCKLLTRLRDAHHGQTGLQNWFTEILLRPIYRPRTRSRTNQTVLWTSVYPRLDVSRKPWRRDRTRHVIVTSQSRRRGYSGVSELKSIGAYGAFVSIKWGAYAHSVSMRAQYWVVSVIHRMHSSGAYSTSPQNRNRHFLGK